MLKLGNVTDVDKEVARTSQAQKVITAAVDRSDRSRDRSIESIDSIDSIIFRPFEIFANVSQFFRGFRKFFQVFGLARTCADLFGCVRMRSDASGYRKRLHGPELDGPEHF